MTKLALASILGFALTFGYVTASSAAPCPNGAKGCKVSGEKCGLDKDCCSKFCRSSNTLRTCK